MKNIVAFICRLYIAVCAFGNACIKSIRKHNKNGRVALTSDSFYQRYIYAYCYRACHDTFALWMLTGKGSTSKYMPYGIHMLANTNVVNYSSPGRLAPANPSEVRPSFRHKDKENIDVKPPLEPCPEDVKELISSSEFEKIQIV